MYATVCSMEQKQTNGILLQIGYFTASRLTLTHENHLGMLHRYNARSRNSTATLISLVTILSKFTQDARNFRRTITSTWSMWMIEQSIKKWQEHKKFPAPFKKTTWHHYGIYDLEKLKKKKKLSSFAYLKKKKKTYRKNA